MGAWSGWQDDLRKAAGLPDTPDNSTFLADWHASADSNCGNNPVDISYKSRGSSNCKRLTSARTAQKYPSHSAAAQAFGSELHSGTFPHLLAALHSGNPYDVPSPHDVIADLIKWGSETFAFELQQNYGPPHGGGGGGVNAPHLHKGWNDFRHTVNKRLPATVHSIAKYNRAALQNLSHARRVRH